MVRMGMRHDDGVQLAHAEAFYLAHERGSGLRRSGVHEDRSAARNDKRGIGLADIEEVRGVLLRKRRPREPPGKPKACTQQHRHRREHEQDAPQTLFHPIIPRRNGTSRTRR